MASTNTLRITLADIVRTESAFATLTATIKDEGVKQDKRIQIGLASACLHAHSTGDTVFINTVIESLSAGLRTNAARDYAVAFAPVRWNKRAKKFVFDGEKVKADVEGNAEHLQFLRDMLETDWLSFRPEADFKPLDIQDATESLLKRMKKAIEGEMRGAHKVDDESIGILATALEEIRAVRGRVEAAALAAEQARKEAEELAALDAETQPE